MWAHICELKPRRIYDFATTRTTAWGEPGIRSRLLARTATSLAISQSHRQYVLSSLRCTREGEAADSVNHVNVLFSRCTFISVQLQATLSPLGSITLGNALQKRKKKERNNTIRLLLSYPIASSSANHETALVGLCVAQARLEKKKQVRKGKNNDSAKDSKICMAARRGQSQIFTCVIHVWTDFDKGRGACRGAKPSSNKPLCLDGR